MNVWVIQMLTYPFRFKSVAEDWVEDRLIIHSACFSRSPGYKFHLFLDISQSACNTRIHFPGMKSGENLYIDLSKIEIIEITIITKNKNL